MDRKECEPSRAGMGRWWPVAAGVGLALCAPAGGAGIRLWPDAVVREPVVRLADVAHLEGFAEASQREALADLVVMESVPPGAHVVVEMAAVRERLRSAGVHLGEVDLYGAVRCAVVRPVDPDAGDVKSPDGSGAQRAQDRPVTLADAIRAFFAERLGALGGHVEVDLAVADAARSALEMPVEAGQYRIEPRGEELLGVVPVDVQVMLPDQPRQVIPVLTQVRLVRSVVVAREPINRGQVIEAEDVTLEERVVKRMRQVGIGDPAAVVGQQARRFIERGEMILERDISPRPLVRRGDPVTVWQRSGGLQIRTAGRALSEGTWGEVVEVKNVASGESFRARVVGPGVVEVVGGSADRSRGAAVRVARGGAS